jgi:hypothetical protein
MAQYHRTLTDPELHEPKGVSTAPADSVYLSTGSGSGLWTPAKILATPPVYGRMLLLANTTAFTLTTQNLWYESGLTHDKLAYGMQLITGTEKFLTPYQGVYRVTFLATVTHSVGSTIEIAIGPTGLGSTTYTSASCPTGVLTNIAYENILELNQASAVYPNYQNKTGAGASLTVKHMQFLVEMVRKV